MYYLIYISTSIKLMEQSDLSEMLIQSRKNNAENNITGMLLYSQGTFIQALEGDKDAVHSTFKIIERDLRHKNIITLITGEVDHRVFPDWSMAFVALAPEKMAELEGYINPLNKELFEGDDSNPAIIVMKTFADNNNLVIS